MIVSLRDSGAAARVAVASGGTHLVSSSGRLGRNVFLPGADFEVFRALVESVTVNFSLTDDAGVPVASGWVAQAYRFALDPTPRQERALWSHAGGRRFAYNWALHDVAAKMAEAALIEQRLVCDGASEEDAHWAAYRTVGIVWSMAGLRQQWNQAKADVAPWWADNSKETYSAGIEAAAAAFSNYFNSRNGTRAGARVGWPTRQRRRGRQSFAYTAGGFGLADSLHAKLPKIGAVKLHESARKLHRRLESGAAHLNRMTVAFDGGRWFVSCQAMVRRDVGRSARPGHNRQERAIAGVDWGVDHLATVATADGRVVKIANPRGYRTHERRLGELQRRRARCTPGSGRHRKLGTQIQRLHAHIAGIRANAIHQLTTWLATTFDAVVIEDLNVNGMTATPQPRPDPDQPGGYLPNGAAAKGGLNKSVLDAAPGELRRQITYKTRWYGASLIVHPRFQQSTGVCECEAKTKLTLDQRTWTCECGIEHDRDGSAAITLARYGHHVAESGSETQNGRTPTSELRPLTGPRLPRTLPPKRATRTGSRAGTANSSNKPKGPQQEKAAA